MYQLAKPFLFLLSPEKAHHLTLKVLSILLAIPGISSIFRGAFTFKHQKLHLQLFGIDFPNPVGLAAGFDKDAKYIKQMSNLGFGFIEIGTVTPKGQPGNPQPRLFRLPQDKGVINRMGFNNEGLEATVARLKNRKDKVIIGGNIGKNKVTPNDEAVNDYILCFEGLFDYVDYFVVNVSSPNTPGLRELQDKGPLLNILSTLQGLNSKRPAPKPILLKIAPDLTDEQLDDIVDIVQTSGIAGLIATNTTIDRSGLTTSSDKIEAIGNGGLSGQPVRERSTEVIRYIHQKSGGSFPIIGVGGICQPKDALEKLAAGASLVQVYSGMIYYGPKLVKDINRAILQETN